MNDFHPSEPGFRSEKANSSASEVLANGEISDDSSDAQTESMVIIDPRVLDRECLSEYLRSYSSKFHVFAFGSRAEWLASAESKRKISAVILSIGGEKASENVGSGLIKKAVAEFYPVPVVVIGDSEDLDHILRAFEYGIRSYIPSSVRLSVCVGIIRLTMAGGGYIPADAVLTMNHSRDAGDPHPCLTKMFTPRETQIALAVRSGKANKMIAYELGMQEGTVKVHIQRIMRKIKATNRTEAAYKIGNILADQSTL